MDVLSKLAGELIGVLQTILGALPYILGYIAIILLALFIWNLIKRTLTPKADYSSLKTVTFGAESAVGVARSRV